MMAHARPWTAEEDARIRDLWDSFPARRIATALSRPVDKVRLHAYELGLVRKPTAQPKSIVVGKARPATQPRPMQSPAPISSRYESYTGCGRPFVFSGISGSPPSVLVSHEERIQSLPPRSDLVDAGDCRMDWRRESGRRQLGVAVLAFLRPERDVVERLLDPFLRQFARRIRGEMWELPGRDVEDWLRERRRAS